MSHSAVELLRYTTWQNYYFKNSVDFGKEYLRVGLCFNPL